MKDLIFTVILFASGAVTSHSFGLKNALLGLVIGVAVVAACSYLNGFIGAWFEDRKP